MAYMHLWIVLYHNKASTEEKEASYCFKEEKLRIMLIKTENEVN